MNDVQKIMQKLDRLTELVTGLSASGSAPQAKGEPDPWEVFRGWLSAVGPCVIVIHTDESEDEDDENRYLFGLVKSVRGGDYFLHWVQTSDAVRPTGTFSDGGAAHAYLADPVNQSLIRGSLPAFADDWKVGVQTLNFKVRQIFLPAALNALFVKEVE